MAMKSLVISLLLLSLSAQAAEIVIVGNIRNKQQILTQLQIQDIYMGRTRAFPDGKSAFPLDQLNLRAEFYQKLTHRPVAQINAYWARLMFSGQTSPPVKVPDDISIIKMIRENEGAIGYINKDSIDEQTMHVLFSMD